LRFGRWTGREERRGEYATWHGDRDGRDLEVSQYTAVYPGISGRAVVRDARKAGDCYPENPNLDDKPYSPRSSRPSNGSTTASAAAALTPLLFR
jgi:hypothetical protein